MSNTTFLFIVTDENNNEVLIGTFQQGVGALFPMKAGLNRTKIENGVSTIASDSAIVSVNLDNGWEVARIQATAILAQWMVNKFNKYNKAARSAAA